MENMMKGNLEQSRIRTDAPANPTHARLPNERDESSDSQTDDVRHPDIKQAYKDIKNGQVNTELRGEQGLDASINSEAGAAPVNPQDAAPSSSKKH